VFRDRKSIQFALWNRSLPVLKDSLGRIGHGSRSRDWSWTDGLTTHAYYRFNHAADGSDSGALQASFDSFDRQTLVDNGPECWIH
jgi:hypothetical protein